MALMLCVRASDDAAPALSPDEPPRFHVDDGAPLYEVFESFDLAPDGSRRTPAGKNPLPQSSEKRTSNILRRDSNDVCRAFESITACEAGGTQCAWDHMISKCVQQEGYPGTLDTMEEEAEADR